MGVSEPRYSAHHAYGVVQVQVQVDLQVGQRPVETFFRIRGERMEEGAANVAVNEEKEGRSAPQPLCNNFYDGSTVSFAFPINTRKRFRKKFSITSRLCRHVWLSPRSITLVASNRNTLMHLTFF
uniref:Uncharacterized protein n=1 Tax=Vespula pensylvanica TaxID=30213 RepID=A0A834NWQ9_VESPE|nr:hypothetical protein H0235_010252 [Vespula pensylvanica]